MENVIKARRTPYEVQQREIEEQMMTNNDKQTRAIVQHLMSQNEGRPSGGRRKGN
jgi:hypothetical protein